MGVRFPLGTYYTLHSTQHDSGMRKFAPVIIAAAMAMIGSLQAGGAITQNRKIIDVVLKIDAPFSTASLTIQQNGFVFYREQQNRQKEINDSSTFTQNQMNIIARLIEGINFFEMKGRPKNANDPLDGSTYTITIRAIPRGYPSDRAFPWTHSVSCYQVSCEHKFLELKNKILELWGKKVFEIGV